MQVAWKACILMVAALMLCADLADGQEPVSAVRNSISLQAGHAWAQGEWTNHPYAPVEYFRQNLVVGGDISFKLTDNLALSVNGMYSGLDTGDWEDFTASSGELVEGTASMGFIAILMRPYLKNTAPDLLLFDIGPLMLFAGGSEKIGTRSLNYDFMSSPRFGGLAAFEYDRCLGGNFAVYLRIGLLYVPSALQYADGWSPSLMTVPLTAGWRVLL